MMRKYNITRGDSKFTKNSEMFGRIIANYWSIFEEVDKLV